MEYDFDIYDAMEPMHLPCSEPDEPECECRFSGDYADASDCDLHNPPRKPMGIWIETPCSCVDGDTRTCFLHGEAA